MPLSITRRLIRRLSGGAALCLLLLCAVFTLVVAATPRFSGRQTTVGHFSQRATVSHFSQPGVIGHYSSQTVATRSYVGPLVISQTTPAVPNINWHVLNWNSADSAVPAVIPYH